MKPIPSNIYESGVPLGQEAERLRNFELPNEVSIELMGQIHDGSKVVDIGSGTNLELNSYVRRQGADYVALDKNPDFLKLQEAAGAQAVLGDACSLPFDSDSFNVVHARFVLAHLGGNKPKGISEAFRVIKPQGRAIFIDYDWSAANGSEAFNKLRDLFVEEMLFDAAFGSQLEGMVRETIGNQAADFSIKRFPVMGMVDYSQVVNLREAAIKDLEVQGKDEKLIQTCKTIFDELKAESSNENAPGFRFPDLVAAVATKNNH